MLIGQSLIAKNQGETVFYSPWFPRGGNAGSFILEVLHISSASVTVDVDFEHKDRNESDSAAASVGTGFSATAVGTYTSSSPPSATGLKEVVRCKVTVAGSPDSGPDDWVHLRMDPPIWQPN